MVLIEAVKFWVIPEFTLNFFISLLDFNGIDGDRQAAA